jgi:hypothetical protein
MKSLLNRFAGKASGHSSDISRDNWFRLLALAGLCLGLVACGGGGGGGTVNLGALRVTVTDSYHTPVAGATVRATVATSTQTGTTDSTGVANLVSLPGTASVTVSRTTFITTPPSQVTIIANQVTYLAETLQRQKAPAGGSLTSRDTPVVSNDGQNLTFQIELVIVDGNSQPITGLGAPAFTLLNCTTNCVSGSSATYNPTTANPTALTVVPGQTAQPYDAALMMDQSGSIATSDPTGARLYSAKAFLDNLGSSDYVLLSAFASGNPSFPSNQYLETYPPFRSSTTLSTAPSYYSTLDSFAGQESGNTPLYDALHDLINGWSTYSPHSNAKAVVIFTDGEDTASVWTLDQVISTANSDGVRVFTIGLSSNVNFETLGKLANDTGGAFLFASSPEQLIPLYGSVGNLLSLSLPTYRLTWTITASSPSTFQSGDTLIGTVQVNAGGSTFNVPFIVGIP